MSKSEIEIDQEHIGRCVRMAIASKNTTNKALADHMGVTPAMIRVYKDGRIYDIRQIYKMAQFYGMNLNEFLQIP